MDSSIRIEQNNHQPPDFRADAQQVSVLLQQMAQEAALNLSAKTCCIYLLDAYRQELIPSAYWAQPNTFTQFTQQTIGHSIVGLAVETWRQQPESLSAKRGLIRVDNLTQDSRFQTDDYQFPHTTILAQPFALPGSLIILGVALVADKIDAPHFSTADEKLLSEFSQRAELALTVKNLQLLQEKQRWAQELIIINQINQTLAASPHTVDREEACRLVLEISYLKELFQFDGAEICLWDEQAQTLTTAHRRVEGHFDVHTMPRLHHLHEGFTGRLAARQQPLLINDIIATDIIPRTDGIDFPFRSYMGAPLKAGDKFLGTLEFAAASPHFWDNRDLNILEVTANQTAIAINYAYRFSFADQQLQTRAHELAGLQRISRELNSTLDLDRILGQVLQEAMRVTHADFGNVSLYDSATELLTAHKEHYGSNLSQLTNRQQFESVPIRLGIMGRALRTGQAAVVPNVLDDNDFIDRQSGTRSQAVVPIIHREHPVGVINLESQQLNCFSEDQLRYLEALANQAAVAIGNAQAYQEQRVERERASRRADQLARLADISGAYRTNRPLEEMLEDIAYAILESVGYNMVLISLVQGDPPALYHTVGAGIPLSELEAMRIAPVAQPQEVLKSLMQAGFSLGQTCFIPTENRKIWQNNLDIPYLTKNLPPIANGASDAHWQPGDLLFVPLTDTNNQIMGIITVDNPDTNLRPTLTTVQPLEIFANHAAAALENARLFEQEQQRRRLANTLRGVAETISSQLELDDLLNIVLQELKNVIDYDSVSVQRLEEDRLVIIGSQGWADNQQVIGRFFSMGGDNPNREVVEAQEPVIVKDVQQQYPAAFAHSSFMHIRGWLGVPLTYGANVLGLMAVNSAQPDCFTADDAEILRAFANQVAVAMQNVRLFEEARQQVRHLAALTEVAQFINRALNLDEVLNQVLDAVFDLVGEATGSIWLVDTGTNTVKIANTKNLPDFMVEALNESALSVDDEPFASVIQSGQTQVVSGNKTENARSGSLQPVADNVTYVPLKTEDSVIGILSIETVIRQKTRLELVATLANMAAVAIENARLVQRLNTLTEQLEQRVAQRTQQLAQTLQDLTHERDRVENLYQITRELSASLDLDRVLTEALNLINRAIGISYGSILLLDHGSGELLYRAALGRSKPLPRGGLRTPYRLGYGLAGAVMELNESRIIPNLSDDPDWVMSTENANRTSAIAVPLITGEGLMGALLLFHPDPDYFTEDHLKLVNAAGAQIANAINNAELYRLITDQAERLGMMLRSQATEAAKNEAILQGIADGVLVLDNRHNVILINPKAAEILGITHERVENQPIKQVLGQADSPVALQLTRQFYDELLQALKSLEVDTFTPTQFRIDVEHKVVVVSLAPVALGSEERLGVVAVIRDISREAEVDRLKNEFISTVSHELRTPLTSIKGYADLLMSAKGQVGELNALQQRFVSVIQSNANRLTELVNDILEISRIETGRVKLEFQNINMIDLLQEVVVSFEGQLVKKEMGLKLDLPESLPPVWADRARLTQILVNLIGNAWQYTPESGAITVSAAAINAEFIQVEIADTGIGIPEEDINHIFDRFFRSERHEVQLVDGTGLGLAITKSFVEMLGGQIWVKSQIDVGTTFSFTIPLGVDD
jgi:PAS domain S-box-containing protein